MKRSMPRRRPVVATLAVIGTGSVLVAALALGDVSRPDPTEADATAAATSSPAGSTAPCAPPEEPTAPLPTAYLAYTGPRQHEDCRTVPDSASTGFELGTLDEPPAVTSTPPDKGIDVIAEWYNDFGLDQTLVGAEWNGWYDWRWNFPTNTGDGVTSMGYDPARHPMLGFYEGDDPRALGWITYWLASSGVSAISLPSNEGFTTDGWTGNWEQRLFEETPNAASLRAILALGCAGTPEEIEERMNSLVDFLAANPHLMHVVERHGGRYVSVNTFDLEAMRGVFDHYEGGSHTRAFLARVADRFRALGYDGVAVHARNAGLLGVDATRAAIRAESGVLVMPSTYEGRYLGKSVRTYGAYARQVDYDTVATSDSVLGAFTSADSAFPHPSTVRIPGSTPELFAAQLEGVADYIVEHDLPRMLSVYNVSEWAEGGPGLIPQFRDGFGYLEAIRTLPPRPRD